MKKEKKAKKQNKTSLHAGIENQLLILLLLLRRTIVNRTKIMLEKTK